MKGDFTRDTFDATRHARRVLVQQGRVLDADHNEGQSIVLHYLESLTADLLGPAAGNGFEIGNGTKGNFSISAGHYYVDGILCENDAGTLPFLEQPHPYWDPSSPPDLDTGTYLVYLDVWERHVASVEDPTILDVALGGPDTCSRSVVVWQVKTQPWSDEDVVDSFFARLQPADRGRLEAEARDDEPEDDPCNISPESQFRGAENQLYRVEIHAGGTAGGDGDTATFKWSRDNGSVVFPIRGLSDDAAELDHLGRDDRSSLRDRDWVELVDDVVSLGDRGRPAPPLLRVADVDRVEMRVEFEQSTAASTVDPARHAYLRRWDHGRRQRRADIGTIGEDGAIEVRENVWLTLEDGVRIRFAPVAAGGEPHRYVRGDYWLIPARVATGDVEWPDDVALPPRGVRHHFAPLATIKVSGANKTVKADAQLRALIKPAVS